MRTWLFLEVVQEHYLYMSYSCYLKVILSRSAYCFLWVP